MEFFGLTKTEINLIDPDENHGNPTRSPVLGPRFVKGTVKSGDDEVWDAHSECSDNEDWLSAEFVNV